ncbi:hypothetical protein Dimus_037554 [Dionaea muscipula]
MDRLSSLPDDVLCYILSFLHIKSAVQTSILSSRWKYLCTFATRLVCFKFFGKFSRLYGINRSTALATVPNECDWDRVVSLVESVSNANTVKLSDTTVLAPSYADVYCSGAGYALSELPIFHNLTNLVICLRPRKSSSLGRKILGHLLSNSPNLRVLIFKDGSFRLCYHTLMEFVQSPKFSWSPNLRFIWVHEHDFSGSTKELKMVMEALEIPKLVITHFSYVD